MAHPYFQDLSQAVKSGWNTMYSIFFYLKTYFSVVYVNLIP